MRHRRRVGPILFRIRKVDAARHPSSDLAICADSDWGHAYPDFEAIRHSAHFVVTESDTSRRALLMPGCVIGRAEFRPELLIVVFLAAQCFLTNPQAPAVIILATPTIPGIGRDMISPYLKSYRASGMRLKSPVRVVSAPLRPSKNLRSRRAPPYLCDLGCRRPLFGQMPILPRRTPRNDFGEFWAKAAGHFRFCEIQLCAKFIYDPAPRIAPAAARTVCANRKI